MDEFEQKLKDSLKSSEDYDLSEDQLNTLRAEVAQNKKRPTVKMMAILASSLSVVCIAIISLCAVLMFGGKETSRYSNSDDCVTSFIEQDEVKNYIGKDFLPSETFETLTFLRCKLYKNKDKNMALEFFYKEAESATPVITEVSFLIELDIGFNYAKDDIYTLDSSVYKINGIDIAQKNLVNNKNLFEKYRKFSYKDHKYYIYSIGLNETLIEDLITETTK